MEYHIDAKNKIFGRLASEIAQILQGKKSATYQKNAVSADKVYLKNVNEVAITGVKAKEKMYHRHTGYMGHLKSQSFEEAFAKNPQNVLREAVRRMLPKNFLNAKRLKNLVFVEDKK